VVAVFGGRSGSGQSHKIKNRIPQNLAESERYENAEESLAKLEEAIEALTDAY
jgi:hypothetical protein